MEQNIKDLMDECLEKWECIVDDPKIEKFKEILEDWIKQFSEEYRPFCYKILNNLDYYSNLCVNKLLEKLHEKLLGKGIDNKYTAYSAITSDDKRVPKSSDLYIQIYKIANHISIQNFVKDIDFLTLEETRSIKEFVFIDDFSGTGKTIIKFLSRNIDKLKDKKIYLVLVHAMYEAVNNINKYATENKIFIEIIVNKVTKKFFSEPIFNKDEISDVMQKTLEESVIKNIPNERIYGYENSQSVVAFHNNTPNNTLGILNHATDIYFPIFPREETITPDWRMQKSRKRDRQRQNYNNKIKNNKGE